MAQTSSRNSTEKFGELHNSICVSGGWDTEVWCPYGEYDKRTADNVLCEYSIRVLVQKWKIRRTDFVSVCFQLDKQ